MKRLLAGLMLVGLMASGQTTPVRVVTTMTCVTNAAGGTALTTALTTTNQPRVGLEIQNNGPNPEWCRFGGSAPAAGTASTKILAGERWPVNAFTYSGDTKGTIKCIAETAAQAGTACTELSEAFAK